MFDDADFEALRPDQTARFTLAELHIPRGNPKPVTLLLRHAGEENETWIRGARAALMREMSKEDAAEYYDKLAARALIVGWVNVLDADGKPIAYTPDRGLELLTRLRALKRTALVNRISAFAGEASNFTAASIDPGDLGNE